MKELIDLPSIEMDYDEIAKLVEDRITSLLEKLDGVGEIKYSKLEKIIRYYNAEVTRRTVNYYITEGIMTKGRKENQRVTYYNYRHVLQYLIINELRKVLKLSFVRAVMKPFINDETELSENINEDVLFDFLHSMLLQQAVASTTFDEYMEKIVESMDIEESDADVDELRRISFFQNIAQIIIFKENMFSEYLDDDDEWDS